MGEELNRTYFYETSFSWSLFLTSYIILRTESITASEISYAIITTFVGIIITRMIIIKNGWRSKEYWLTHK